MPYCTQCGSQVAATDAFCSGCGARQGMASAPPAGGPRPASGPSSGASQTAAGAAKPDQFQDFVDRLSDRKAAMLCYIPIVGWIASIAVLAADKFREARDVRFHAFQGLYLFVLWLFVDWVFDPLTAHIESIQFVGRAMKAVVFGAWIFMLIKTRQGENFRLPFLGELADRSVSEQR